MERIKCLWGLQVPHPWFKGQQTYIYSMSTSFTITGKQSLVTALLHSKLGLHVIHVKLTLCLHCDRLFMNAKTVFWNIQLLCTTTKNFMSSKMCGQMTHEKLYHQLFPNLHLWYEGQNKFYAHWLVCEVLCNLSCPLLQTLCICDRTLLKKSQGPLLKFQCILASHLLVFGPQAVHSSCLSNISCL